MSPPVTPTHCVSSQASAMSNSFKPKRNCRPGYKSRSKILRSASRLQAFMTDKARKKNTILRNENEQLKQDLTGLDKLNLENLKLKRHVESLELQSMTHH